MLKTWCIHVRTPGTEGPSWPSLVAGRRCDGQRGCAHVCVCVCVCFGDRFNYTPQQLTCTAGHVTPKTSEGTPQQLNGVAPKEYTPTLHACVS